MPSENRIELARYRINTAKEKLESAKILLDNANYKDVISYFQKEYIKTGKIDKQYSKYLSQAFQIRNNTDYADFYVVSKQDALEQYERADAFCKEIENYINLE